ERALRRAGAAPVACRKRSRGAAGEPAPARCAAEFGGGDRGPGRAPVSMTPPRRVLVVVPRRIGDVLLATPLIRSLRRAWPQAQLHVLVFEGTQGVIAANPDIDRIITVTERPGWLEHLRLLARIARRYD